MGLSDRKYMNRKSDDCWFTNLTNLTDEIIPTEFYSYDKSVQKSIQEINEKIDSIENPIFIVKKQVQKRKTNLNLLSEEVNKSFGRNKSVSKWSRFMDWVIKFS